MSFSSLISKVHVLKIPLLTHFPSNKTQQLLHFLVFCEVEADYRKRLAEGIQRTRHSIFVTAMTRL